MKKENNNSLAKTEAELKKAVKILEKYKRKAYLPVVSQNINEFSDKSKIGGYPYLRNENDWPLCPNCLKNMQLFLQLNLNDLPENKKNGMIQLFYCTSENPNCEIDLEAYYPFSEATVCRKIESNGESSKITPNIDVVFDEKLIVDWTEVDDYPDTIEYSENGIDLDIDDDILELMEIREICVPIEKDKLFGWPRWVQDIEYPSDRQTLTQMELLFQFVSEDNLPYMFGDDGIGHLTQSLDNENELAFGWACG